MWRVSLSPRGAQSKTISKIPMIMDMSVLYNILASNMSEIVLFRRMETKTPFGPRHAARLRVSAQPAYKGHRGLLRPLSFTNKPASNFPKSHDIRGMEIKTTSIHPDVAFPAASVQLAFETYLSRFRALQVCSCCTKTLASYSSKGDEPRFMGIERIPRCIHAVRLPVPV